MIVSSESALNKWSGFLVPSINLKCLVRKLTNGGWSNRMVLPSQIFSTIFVRFIGESLSGGIRMHLVLQIYISTNKIIFCIILARQLNIPLINRLAIS